jgi:hypothetical protein
LIKKPEALLRERERQLGIVFPLLRRDGLWLCANAFLLKPLLKQFALLKSELIWSDEISYISHGVPVPVFICVDLW